MKRIQRGTKGIAIVSNSSALPLVESITKKKRPSGFFTKMNDDELIAFAAQFVVEKRIRNRYCLEKEDVGLYQVLWKRNLLDFVFPQVPVETPNLKDLADALEKF